MAGSRLDKIGTIYSRFCGMLKSGAVKSRDRPIWFDVYEVFPPRLEPHFDRTAAKEEISPIYYEEDEIRATFFDKFGPNPRGEARELADSNYIDPSTKFVEVYKEIISESDANHQSQSQLYEVAFQKYREIYGVQEAAVPIDLREKDRGKRRARSSKLITRDTLVELFKEAKEKQNRENKDD